MQRVITASAAVLLLHGVCPGATLKVLHAFGGNPDGSAPESNLIFDGAGHLYGTTYAGGTGIACLNGCGTIFQLTPDGTGGFTERVIHSFQGPLIDGQNPQAPLILDAQGNLYGTTYSGGQSARRASGTVFKLSPNGDGSWTETVLHNFNGALDGGHDGGDLQGGLVFDGAGNLYGTTAGGGTGTGCGAGPATGCGTVFELTPTASGEWQETVLHNFTNNHSDGWRPRPPAGRRACYTASNARPMGAVRIPAWSSMAKATSMVQPSAAAIMKAMALSSNSRLARAAIGRKA